MAVKLRISYKEPWELQAVAERLEPLVRSCKAEKGGNGRFKRAYMDLEVPEEKAQKGAGTPLA